MVELLRTYSRHLSTLTTTLGRLEKRIATLGDNPAAPRSQPRYIHKVADRLPTEVLNQLVRDYESGQSMWRLIETYGLGKSAVIRILREANAEIRHQGLDADGEAEAVRLYLLGQSAATVAVKLGPTPPAARANRPTQQPKRGPKMIITTTTAPAGGGKKDRG